MQSQVLACLREPPAHHPRRHIRGFSLSYFPPTLPQVHPPVHSPNPLKPKTPLKAMDRPGPYPSHPF
ncbi:hypothetical protein BU24DRAFT_418722 [Aaosphaeria arxii CBS 175.79]|uniref:Uncharacterized protein n=1 Tax=Aaosphaeria arxii CBS 175.79 TaxID=1450172 RepID=A0A6A5Y2U1_9PLEO|nr:uncharacterized protein BU24DRAFT_418722 [Aaosphaeria arxii CBS 175.79]KAF2019120.1 hypothetical protein BU24DRAFT_418722 [Aaosphaeria arxii CBS 175.79]